MVASPWLDIPLADHEGHMALSEIAQARMLADELEGAVRQHAPNSAAIIGCSGGNGLERLIGSTVERIVGIDINPTYVAAAQARFGTQLPNLALYVADIQDALPNIAPIEIIFAGLIFEYVRGDAQLAATSRTGRDASRGFAGAKRGDKGGIAIAI
jgi:trans-aconitate methyltransferase